MATIEEIVKRQTDALNKVSYLECNADLLAPDNPQLLPEAMQSLTINKIWDRAAPALNGLGIPDHTGGVNIGDRRALFYLINQIQPAHILEIGTHIGASTVHMATAMNEPGKQSITTVDIKDVNDESTLPWKSFGSYSSPKHNLQLLGLDNAVSFVVAESISFLNSCKESFDLIFLDGDHTAAQTYQEIAASLKLLNSDGIIVLHDYYPDLNPLWPNVAPLPGTFLALNRLTKEGLKARAVPFGGLPWPTKLGSNLSSLALLQALM